MTALAKEPRAASPLVAAVLSCRQSQIVRQSNGRDVLVEVLYPAGGRHVELDVTGSQLAALTDAMRTLAGLEMRDLGSMRDAAAAGHVPVATLSRWVAKIAKGGLMGLVPKRSPGRPARAKKQGASPSHA